MRVCLYIEWERFEVGDSTSFVNRLWRLEDEEGVEGVEMKNVSREEWVDNRVDIVSFSHVVFSGIFQIENDRVT